jgi:hypothetical protein
MSSFSVASGSHVLPGQNQDQVSQRRRTEVSVPHVLLSLIVKFIRGTLQRIEYFFCIIDLLWSVPIIGPLAFVWGITRLGLCTFALSGIFFGLK